MDVVLIVQSEVHFSNSSKSHDDSVTCSLLLVNSWKDRHHLLVMQTQLLVTKICKEIFQSSFESDCLDAVMPRI